MILLGFVSNLGKTQPSVTGGRPLQVTISHENGSNTEISAQFCSAFRRPELTSFSENNEMKSSSLSLSTKVIHLHCNETRTHTHAHKKPQPCETRWEPARVYLTQLNRIVASASAWQRRGAASWKRRVCFRADNQTTGRKGPVLLLFGHSLAGAGGEAGGPGGSKRVGTGERHQVKQVRRRQEKPLGRREDVFWEKHRDGRNVGREQAGEGCTAEGEKKKYQGGGKRRKSNLKSGAPYSPHPLLVSAWTTAYAGDTRQGRAEHRLEGDSRGWQCHQASRGELELALSSPSAGAKNRDSTGGDTHTEPFSCAFRCPGEQALLPHAA